MYENVISRLKQISIFDEITGHEERLKLLLKICRLRRYKKNAAVIREGEMGTEMFVVISGSVEIRKKTRAGDDYTVASLAAEHNVFFGELALIDDDRRSATVITREDAEFLVLDKDSLLKLGKDHPEIAYPITRAIARILAGRLRKTTGDMLTIFDALVTEIGSG